MPTVPLSADLLRRAELYLDKVPPAIQGQNGSGKLFWAVTALLWKFGLDEEATKQLIFERYNHRCEPPWSEKEIDHKIADAKAKPPTKLANWETESLVRFETANPPAIVTQNGE